MENKEQELEVRWQELENVVKTRNFELINKRYWALWTVLYPEKAKLKRLKEKLRYESSGRVLTQEEIDKRRDEINKVAEELGLNKQF